MNGNSGTFVPPNDWFRPEREHVRVPVLLLATLLAALLRWPGLGAHPLWIDELQTWRQIDPSMGFDFVAQVRDYFQSPLLVALLWPWTGSGLSEWVLRAPSAVAGVAAVPLLGLLADRWGGRRTAEWSVLFFALSPFHIWYSQDGRGYALLVFFALAASLLLTRMLRRPPRIGEAVGYAVLAGLALLSNNSALFLVAAHALTVALLAFPRRWRDLLLWGLAFGGAVLIAMPWLLTASGLLAVENLAPGAAAGSELRSGEGFTLFALPFSVHTFWYGFSLGPSLFELHRPDRLDLVLRALPLLAPAWFVAGCLAIAGWWGLRRGVRVTSFLWLVVPMAAVSFLAWRNVKAFNPRYLAAAMPVLLILTAHGVARLGRLGRWLGVLHLLFILSATAGYMGWDRYAREDVRSAAVHVAAHGHAEEPVLVPVVSGLYELYAEGDQLVVPFWGRPVIRDDAAADATLVEALGEADSAWVVLCRSWDLDPGDRLPAALARLGRVREAGRWPGVRLLRWRRGTAEAEVMP